MRTRIKFCGITRLEDALAAARLGVDALGFVFHPKSPRAIDLNQACAIARELPAFIARVALFLDAEAEQVTAVIKALQPQALQFHGRESPDFCVSFAMPYLKALGMDGATDVAANAARYPSAKAILLDSHMQGAPGGSGKSFDWRLVPRLPQPIILAGGLREENVAQAVTAVRPYAVDVSSGIEREPGVKDEKKMRGFIREVQRADAL
ncbi:MAG: phosphoribosylanthranilate isomerase [Nevskiales bacterium]